MKEHGVTLSDGTHWEVWWYGFGDVKFILELLALSGASANYKCHLCEAHADSIHAGQSTPGVMSCYILKRPCPHGVDTDAWLLACNNDKHSVVSSVKTQQSN